MINCIEVRADGKSPPCMCHKKIKPTASFLQWMEMGSGINSFGLQCSKFYKNPRRNCGGGRALNIRMHWLGGLSYEPQKMVVMHCGKAEEGLAPTSFSGMKELGPMVWSCGRFTPCSFREGRGRGGTRGQSTT